MFKINFCLNDQILVVFNVFHIYLFTLRCKKTRKSSEINLHSTYKQGVHIHIMLVLYITSKIK